MNYILFQYFPLGIACFKPLLCQKQVCQFHIWTPIKANIKISCSRHFVPQSGESHITMIIYSQILEPWGGSIPCWITKNLAPQEGKEKYYDFCHNKVFIPGFCTISILLISYKTTWCQTNAYILSQEQGKSEGFDSCDQPSNLTQIGFKSSIFHPCDLEIWWMTRKIIRHDFYTTSSFVYHFRSISEFKLELQSGNAQSGSNSKIFSGMWPCNLTYDLEKQ